MSTPSYAEREARKLERIERAKARATEPLNTPALDGAAARALGYRTAILKALPQSQSDLAMKRAVGREVVIDDRTTACGDFVHIRYGKTEMWARPADLEDVPQP